MYKDPEKHRAYGRTYQKTHRASINVRKRRYREENPFADVRYRAAQYGISEDQYKLMLAGTPASNRRVPGGPQMKDLDLIELFIIALVVFLIICCLLGVNIQ